VTPIKPKHTKRKPEHFATGVGRPLRRAAKDAQKIARMYNTPLYYWENGKVVARKPWLSKSSRVKTSARKAKT
jgi:hypothetical protein